MISEPATSAPRPVTSLRPLDNLRSALFVHTVHLPNEGHPHAGVNAIRDLLSRDAIGVIYTIPRSKNRLAIATACAHQTRQRFPDADILLDASLYTGSTRKTATTAIDQIDLGWINRQHADGLRWALTDSGYVAHDDRQGLRKILQESAQAHQRAQLRNRGVLAALPLASAWLTEHADILADAISQASTPVALMLEDEHDPLSRKNAVTGLVSVLQVNVPVAVLRCDMSVLGALAYGAAAVSVGDSSTLRHFYPIKDNNGGSSKPPLATLVPKLLGYYHLTKIDDAITACPRLPVWLCSCRVCGGRRLDWIANTDPNLTRPDVAAFEHAVSALAGIARELFGNSVPACERPARWFEAVQDAQINHSEVIAGTGQPWEPKSALGRWVTHYTQTTSTTSVLD
jgi:hypothetical protein